MALHSLYPASQQGILLFQDISLVHLYQLKKLWVPGDLNNDHAESLLSGAAEHPSILRPSFEYNYWIKECVPGNLNN